MSLRRLYATGRRFLSFYGDSFKLQLSVKHLSTVSYPLQLSSVSPNHAALYEESVKHPELFWGDLARRRLKWFKEFDQVMDCDMTEGRISWFNGGKINASGEE